MGLKETGWLTVPGLAGLAHLYPIVWQNMHSDFMRGIDKGSAAASGSSCLKIY
ncbi:hypothetical protein BN77_2289 [Rhizobium mesoamericanum STM3625]|uniref:Uncharacterized protein n=1 Tax=Rhizobium mesoamericanum STM3625 TaxID=1211777 RepID=K0PF05_9HYPH|nr:hypothetical protein BN77_2289 [Rhizobium mesoamericanum STM3625]